MRYDHFSGRSALKGYVWFRGENHFMEMRYGIAFRKVNITVNTDLQNNIIFRPFSSFISPVC